MCNQIKNLFKYTDLKTCIEVDFNYANFSYSLYTVEC